LSKGGEKTVGTEVIYRILERPLDVSERTGGELEQREQYEKGREMADEIHTTSAKLCRK